MKYKHIQVDEYNPEWPKMFEEESQLIKAALGNNCIALHHVGSTSVSGLLAKPTIDIIGVIKDRKAAITDLEAAGYQYRGEYNIPLRLFFNRKAERDINLHVYENGHPDIVMNLVFRDYLKAHPEAVKRYIALKQELLTKQSSFLKTNSSYTGYNLGKDAFIREILNKAGFNRLRTMCCTHHEEWNSAKKLRAQYYKEKGITDSYDWTQEDSERKHLVLYKGTEIIGYAQVDFRTEEEATVSTIVISKIYQNEDYEKKFVKFIEHWLTTLRYSVTHKVG